MRPMRYRYLTCDVFTDTRFGGNPLAVLPDAQGLDAVQMQRIAREFNYSETTFVTPPTAGGTRAVRIFTPEREVPFAGHPNIGTAFVLAHTGELGEWDDATTVTFEETAGLVPVAIERVAGRGGALRCELEAPERFSTGPAISAEDAAGAIGLDAAEVVVDTHPPQGGSVGLPFLFVEVRDRAALARARPDREQIEALGRRGVPTPVHVYCPGGDDVDLRARMFAPVEGVREDPATGSANCALAGLLAHCALEASGEFRFRIAQGVEMGRPSLLHARATKGDGLVHATYVGGEAVAVAEGWIEVG